jgi:hypothetical protein
VDDRVSAQSAQCVHHVAAHCETQCASRRDFYTKSCVSRFLIDLCQRSTLNSYSLRSGRPYSLCERCKETVVAELTTLELSETLNERHARNLEAELLSQESRSDAA